jgi:hypothetical protein
LCLAVYLIPSCACPTVVCETRSVPLTKFCICFPPGVCRICSSPLLSIACLPNLCQLGSWLSGRIV